EGWQRRLLFCFQAEDGIRDFHVTGVQTCALPILDKRVSARGQAPAARATAARASAAASPARIASCAPGTCRVWAACRYSARGVQIGRASCRERAGVAEGGAFPRKRDERQ